MSERDPWFAPKRFGWGVGLPLNWQGWLASALYIATILVAAWLLDGRPMLLLSIAASATILFLAVAARRTRGGWHWRWDGKRTD